MKVLNRLTQQYLLTYTYSSLPSSHADAVVAGGQGNKGTTYLNKSYLSWFSLALLTYTYSSLRLAPSPWSPAAKETKVTNLGVLFTWLEHCFRHLLALLTCTIPPTATEIIGIIQLKLSNVGVQMLLLNFAQTS